MVARNEVMGDRQALFSGWMGSALDCAVDAASAATFRSEHLSRTPMAR